MSLNKDLVSSFVAEVAGPSSNPDATDKEVSQTDVPKHLESKTTQNSGKFKGMCMKKYAAVEFFFCISFLYFHYHFSAL